VESGALELAVLVVRGGGTSAIIILVVALSWDIAALSRLPFFEFPSGRPQQGVFSARTSRAAARQQRLHLVAT
jgi:hypothetical protein